MPLSHRRRRRDESVEFSRVGGELNQVGDRQHYSACSQRLQAAFPMRVDMQNAHIYVLGGGLGIRMATFYCLTVQIFKLRPRTLSPTQSTPPDSTNLTFSSHAGRRRRWCESGIKA